ncbi:MAG: winged helix-turn-helix domain-containing protein [Nannocystaceae bacterium]
MTSSSAHVEHVWTFLSNYAHVLVCLARDPDATQREIAERVGVTERAIARIISELEAVGVISHRREGRRNHYEIDLEAPLRHPLEAERTVGDLLSALLSRREAVALGLRRR